MIANLKHAARNRETVTIGGGEFGPEELSQIAALLESRLEIANRAEALITALDQELPHNMKHIAAPQRFNLRSAIARTLEA
jgi:hypothetical protein